MATERVHHLDIVSPSGVRRAFVPDLKWDLPLFFFSRHKVIILHRPYLGRAFKDPRYKRSRDACVGAARRILRLLKSCEIEAFRKTWTVLACVFRSTLPDDRSS